MDSTTSQAPEAKAQDNLEAEVGTGRSLVLFILCFFFSQLPDRTFFDACARGDNDYLQSRMGEGTEFEWGREFEFSFLTPAGSINEV